MLGGGKKLWWVGGGIAVVVVAALLGWLLWPDGTDPRARVYTDATACLLTPAAGVADPQAAPVWAGMQQASLATRGKVQYLEVDGPQTSAQAATFLATLAAGSCDLVLTAGKSQNDALTTSASSYPNVSFVLVGTGSVAKNVSVIDANSPDEVRAKVADVVTAALKAAADD